MSFLEKLSAFDRKASEALRIEPQDGFFFKTAAVLAHSGDSWILCGIMFIFWLFAKGETERTIAYWAGAIVLTALFVFCLKRVIARTRPEGQWGAIYRSTDPYSFPSGHSVRSGLIMMFALHTFQNKWIIIMITIWAILMILSRVATGVHYLLDVLAGFVLGLLIGWLWVVVQPIIYTNFPWLFDKTKWFQ